MRRLAASLALCLAAACGPQTQVAQAPAAAAPHAEPGIEVTAALIRPAAAGAVSAGYLTLSAHGAPDRLLAASSPAAERIELHAHTAGEDGLLQMRQVAGGIEVAAGERLAFAPGGLHLMLFNLTGDLAPGQSAPVTLTFERAGPVEVQFQVGEPPPPGAAAAPTESHGGHR